MQFLGTCLLRTREEDGLVACGVALFDIASMGLRGKSQTKRSVNSKELPSMT